MNHQQELERFFNVIDAYKKSQTNLTTANFLGFQKLFQDPFFHAFLKTSPLVVAIYNFPSQRYDFVSESISDVCFLSPNEFLGEQGAGAFLKAMDEPSRKAMMETITPLMMNACSEYVSDIKNLRFTACISVVKNELVKKWVLLHMYILEATPEGFPILSCTLVNDVTEIKKDTSIYHSGKLLKNGEETVLYQDTLSESDADLKLTKREFEILKQLCQGKTSKEIAENLHVSFYTIKKHRNNILTKTGVSNTPELINKATIMGLV